MKDKRIGNDISVVWTLMRDGAPFNISGLPVTLYLRNMYGKTEIEDFTVSKNQVKWTFYGKDQKQTGKYSLVLVVNEDKEGMLTTDACDFVNLVSCSCKVGNGADECGVQTETIELTSTIEYVAGGGTISIEIDSELSEESTNPVENRVITGELAKKVNKSDLATINGQRIDEGGNIEIEGGGSTPDLSGYLTKEEFNKASEDFATTDALEGKQDTIEDLNSIRSGAEKGATAVQPSILEDYATTQQLTELSAKVGELENKGEGGAVSPTNGVGGVTSSTSILQGGVVTNQLFDIARNWYLEVVVKLQNGSDITMAIDRALRGNALSSTNFRINNGNVQLLLYQNGTRIIPINIGITSLNMNFDEWYHLMLVYDGNIIYLYANGRKVHQSTSYNLAVDADTIGAWEQNAIHSPKLLRVGYWNGGEADDIASQHYNGNNPFGYVAEKADLLVEYLPSNMLKTKIVNTANDMEVVYASEKAFDIQTENPWAAVVRGEGTPTILPAYVGQKYEDTLTGKTYTAIGNSTIADWSSPVTSQDLADLKTQTKTINGQSIWGNGDISVGAGGAGSSQYISVIDKGAIGDGASDDTDAIMSALEAARVSGKALYFPNGTYLTRKSLVMTSNMHIIGEPGAVLQNAAATIEGGGKCPFTTLTQTASKGATSIMVSDASKFRVGDEIVVWKSGSYTETMADIVSISGKTITIDTSRFTSDGQNGGILNEVASGGYVLTDFAMVKTIMTKAAENVTIEGITIKPMSDMNEPHIYPSSPISQTKQTSAAPQKNFRVIGVTIYDSANDGISLQGAGESVVVGCRVYNQKHKGIHWGTNHDMIRIEGNYVYGCGFAQYDNPSDYQGSGAMFFCSYCRRTIIRDNFIENCYRGVYGFNYQGAGEQDTDTLISGNTFKNCGQYGVLLRGGYRAIVTDNTFINFGGSSVALRTEQDGNFPFLAGVISNNVFGEFAANFAGDAMQITGAKNVSIGGNIVSDAVFNSTTIARPNCNVKVESSENVILMGNVVAGSITTSESTNVVNVNNISQ